jgi:hypothetical protein
LAHVCFLFKIKKNIVSKKNRVGFILGIGSSSPLKIELEFGTNLADNWVLAYTFSNLNRVDYSGSPSKQDVVFTQIK